MIVARRKGRPHVPRPEEEYVVVEGYCEPIFSRKEMEEVLKLATEIEGEPPRRTGSEHLLSGLVYYRCRRASSNGACTMRQVPAAALAGDLTDPLGCPP